MATVIGSCATFLYSQHQDAIAREDRLNQQSINRVTAVESFLKHLESNNTKVQAVAALAISELGKDTPLALQAASLTPSEDMRDAINIIAQGGTDADSKAAQQSLERVALWAVRKSGGYVITESCDVTEVALPSLTIFGEGSGSELRYLTDFPRLKRLDLRGSRIGDSLLPQLYPLSITELDLRNTPVTTLGIARLKARMHGTAVLADNTHEVDTVLALENLGADVRLGENGYVSEVQFPAATRNEDVALLKDLPFLTAVRLDGAQAVTDIGVAHLQHSPQLQTVGLSLTRVTDASIDVLEKLKSCKEVILLGVPITDAGAASLSESLPDANVLHDHKPTKTE